MVELGVVVALVLEELLELVVLTLVDEVELDSVDVVVVVSSPMPPPPVSVVAARPMVTAKTFAALIEGPAGMQLAIPGYWAL